MANPKSTMMGRPSAARRMLAGGCQRERDVLEDTVVLEKERRTGFDVVVGYPVGVEIVEGREELLEIGLCGGFRDVGWAL